MKKILITICAIFIACIARADNATINWYVDGNVYDTTTCTIGGDIILPTAPNVPGHTFLGWKPLYTQLEYIESTGTQWIDTGFKPNQDSGMIIDFYAIRSDEGDAAFLYRYNGDMGFGVTQNTSRPLALLLYNGGAQDSDGFVISNTSLYGAGTGRYVVDINKQNISVTASDGSVLTKTIPLYTYQMPISLWLFAYRRDAPTPLDIPAPNVRIYSCKLYDNGTLVRDFVPARRNSDGVLGMYDKVSETFFTNAGTGTFVAGPIIGEE